MIIELNPAPNLPSLHTIFLKARSATPGYINTLALEDFQHSLEGEQIFTASLEGNVVGFLSIWVQENFIHHLYIDPPHQRSGTGSALIKQCAQEFGLPLSLKCMKAVSSACAFYSGTGWQAVEEKEGPEGTYILFRLNKSEESPKLTVRTPPPDAS